MDNQIIFKKLRDIDLTEPFFNSLRNDYIGFDSWFTRKANEKKGNDYLGAFVFEAKGKLEGFLFLKSEIDKEISDITPKQPSRRWLKIGTFKINPHGTRLGERFLKKTFDNAFKHNFDAIYVTVFPKHKALIQLLEKYGFVDSGTKESPSGIENVYIKDLKIVKNDVLLDYPKFNTIDNNKILLSIYPEHHTKLFPDSILNNETYNDIVMDISHTNSIEKMYISGIDCSALKKGDNIIIYRTGDGVGPAKYRSVVTSVCTIEEVKSKYNFTSETEFIEYCKKHSVFKEVELKEWYNKKTLYAIKMVYNAALKRRINREALINIHKLNGDIRWSIYQLSDNQFHDIITQGDIYASLIIN